jgi:hypothetical protein
MDRGWAGAAASDRWLPQRQNQYLQQMPIEVDADLGVLAGWLRMDMSSVKRLVLEITCPPSLSRG